LSTNKFDDIVILAGARTPMAEWVGGKRGDGLNGGALASVSALELGAAASRAALERAGVPATRIDHVVMGNALQTSADAIYGARHVGLKAGVSEECPALTVNRLCGSGLQSVATAAQLLQLGEANWVLAGGMENMSQAPHVLRGARGGLEARPRLDARGLAVRGAQGHVLRLLHGADERQPRAQVRADARAAGRVRAAVPRARQHGQHERSLRAGDRTGRGQDG
jgi:acetyl-CoA acetyltransferase